ncbi:hypothetical protein VD0004_g378 [Verticillium dahliae]|nr:hypothetical protein VD0004_g378 [Verticillium dahliae]PNH77225.1 hypothetical protein VD0001_g301 [Verticillium dahliae]
MVALTSRLALALLAASPLSASVLRPRAGANRQWVSVDSDGNAHTYIPTSTQVNGVATTLSAAPYILTGSVFTVTATNGDVSTSTGAPPPPRATDSDGGRGVFNVCMDNANSQIAPFCQPRARSELYVKEPYYITWDSSGFGADLNTVANIVGLAVTRQSGTPTNAEPNFVINDTNIVLGKGYYAWTPSEADLKGSTDFHNVTLMLQFVSSESNELTNVMGPTIALLPARANIPEEHSDDDDDDDDDNDNDNDDDNDDDDDKNGGPNVLAIALPIVFVVLAIAGLAAFCLFRRKRRNAAAGASINRTSSGFGAQAAHDQHLGRKDNNDIQLEDRSDTVSPISPASTSGRNVFQEEVARQDRERM